LFAGANDSGVDVITLRISSVRLFSKFIGNHLTESLWKRDEIIPITD
jgi:hypothetical protein